MKVREPSIHIKISRLREVLIELGEGELKEDYIIESIISASKKDNLSHRSMLVDTKKMEKVASKAITSTSSDTDYFNQLLFLIRKKHKHRVRAKFDKGSREFTTIQKASELAIDFCNEFKLDRKEGFTKYIEIYLKLSGKKTWLNNLVSKFDYYCSFYESELAILNDMNKEFTNHLLSLFEHEIMRVTGVVEKITNQLDIVHFVKASEVAIELGVTSNNYMAAQFEGLDFTGGIPYPSQISNEKARSRVIKYMAKHNIRTRETIKSKVNWADILKK